MSNRRTDITRSLNVRFNSQILAELMRYYHNELGWEINSMGGFIRDMIESLHYVLEANDQKFQQLQLNSIEEAEQILTQFNAGQVNQQNLSLTASQQRQFGEVDPFYRPQTKNPRKNIRRQQRRQLTSQTAEPSFSSQTQMPQEVWELYEQLKPGEDKEMVDAMIVNVESLPDGWEGVKTLISNKLDDS